jgi:hypothetical protein
MNPGAGFARPSDDLIGRIEGTRVHVARLYADDRRPLEERQTVSAHAPLAVDGHAVNALSPEAQHRKDLVERGMRFLAEHDREQRRAEQPLLVHVPAPLAEHVVARRSEAGEVCHRGTGDERPSAEGGRLSASLTHRRAVISKHATAGELTKLKQF